MDDAQVLSDLFLRFLASDRASEVGRVQSLVDSFRASVDDLMLRSVGDLLNSKRISFASPDRIVYPDVPEDVAELIKTDTLVLQGLELSEGCVGSVCQAVAGQPSRIVGASAYISTIDVRKFGWHLDEWDSLIFQLAGRKVFYFRGLDSVELSSGDFLMFKKGEEHRTRTIEKSIHVSITVRDI